MNSQTTGIVYDYCKYILTFGLSSVQLESVRKKLGSLSIKVGTQSEKIIVRSCYQMTDILAYPGFMIIANLEQLSEAEKVDLFEFWAECEEPLSKELKKLYGDVSDKSQLIYLIDENVNIPQKLKRVYHKPKLLENLQTLRLDVLSEIKDNEGNGKSSETSIRISRVLKIYKALKEGEIFRIDDYYSGSEDMVSTRTLLRDIQIINDVEYGDVKYDRNQRGYILQPHSTSLIAALVKKFNKEGTM